MKMALLLVMEYLAPEDLLKIDRATEGYYRQEVVQHLVKSGWFRTALVNLNKRCDSQTFEMVLFSLPKDVSAMYARDARDVLKQMKALSYKRNLRLFERARTEWNLSREMAFDLFSEVRGEIDFFMRGDEAGATRLYDYMLNMCKSCDEALAFVREARSKGLKLNAIRFATRLVGEDASQMARATSLIVEAGDSTSEETIYGKIIIEMASSSTEKVTKALQQMKSFGYKPSVELYDKLITSAPSQSFHLFLAMADECEVAATPKCYRLVLKHCCKGSFDNAMKVVKEVKRTNAMEVDDLDVTECVFELVASHRVPDAVALLMEFGNYDEKAAIVMKSLRIRYEKSQIQEFFESLVASGDYRVYPLCCKEFFTPFRVMRKDKCFVPMSLLLSFLLVDNPDYETCMGAIHCLKAAHMFGEAKSVAAKFLR